MPQKESAVKKKITLLGVVWLFISRNMYADIGIISPFYDSNCDQYFDNQALIFDPAWQGMGRSNALTTLVAYIVEYMAGYPSNNQRTLAFDNLTENNLYCFTIPTLIEASNARHFNRIYLITNILMSVKQQMPDIKTNTSGMCCYVSLSPQQQPITT